PAGSPAANEYRPHRSERSTLSSRIPGPSPASAGKTPTGVETSASSSVQIGTSGQSRASRSNVSGSGLTRIALPPQRRRPRGAPPGPPRDPRWTLPQTRAGWGLLEPQDHDQVLDTRVIVRRLCGLAPARVNAGGGEPAARGGALC